MHNLNPTLSPISVELIHHVGSDITVANAARVSFAKRTEELTDRDVKLIKYLADHKHHSPFNHSFMTFCVKAPIFVARQLVKHKFMPWNEVSRRYVDSTPEFYQPDGWRGRAENVKQGSTDETVWKADTVPISVRKALEEYSWMIEAGVCPEQARMVLPQSMMTEWWWSGTLGAFLDMLVLRLDSHTQKETRIVADLIAQHVKQHFPVAYGAYISE